MQADVQTMQADVQTMLADVQTMLADVQTMLADVNRQKPFKRFLLKFTSSEREYIFTSTDSVSSQN